MDGGRLSPVTSLLRAPTVLITRIQLLTKWICWVSYLSKKTLKLEQHKTQLSEDKPCRNAACTALQNTWELGRQSSYTTFTYVCCEKERIILIFLFCILAFVWCRNQTSFLGLSRNFWGNLTPADKAKPPTSPQLWLAQQLSHRQCSALNAG